MYNEKFVAVIKHKGKILRDDCGIVRLPFGSEYTILLKNKNSVKAVANVEVDGKDVLQSYGIIVPPNQSVEITGWMRDMSKTNKFKFIQKTKQIQKFRGNRVDDGLIRVEYRFEKKCVPKVTSNPWEIYCGNNDEKWSWSTVTNCNSDANYISKCSAQSKDEGITVKGKVVDQEYQHGSTDLLENVSSVIIINLYGISKAGKKVEKVITTRSRIQCDICGKKWKSNIKYCGNCGNYLQ